MLVFQQCYRRLRGPLVRERESPVCHTATVALMAGCGV